MASGKELSNFRTKTQIIRQLPWRNLKRLGKPMLSYPIQKRDLNMIDMAMNLLLNNNNITNNKGIPLHSFSIMVQCSNNSINSKDSLISRKDSLNFPRWAISIHFSIKILILFRNSMTFSKMIHFSNKTFLVTIRLKMETLITV